MYKYTKKIRPVFRRAFSLSKNYFLSVMVFCCLVLFFFVAFFEYFINRFLDCCD